jgi:hypothetical protein
MNMHRFAIFCIVCIILPVSIFSQEEVHWYNNLPQKAEILENDLVMKIGNKSYRVYNAFDPIAPTGGERVINYAGALDYYMWIFNSNGGFKIAKIDRELNIYYYDEITKKFTNPEGTIFPE